MEEIAEWSLQEFGEATADRYEALLFQALTDIQENPFRPSVQRRSELAGVVFVYHLRHSKERARIRTGIVRHPRHVVAYSVDGKTIEILRILHDARDLERHVP